LILKSAKYSKPIATIQRNSSSLAARCRSSKNSCSVLLVWDPIWHKLYSKRSDQNLVSPFWDCHDLWDPKKL